MTEWIKDANGNKCSVEYWGSREAAQNALDSLKNCRDCVNCSRCSRCSEGVAPPARPLVPTPAVAREALEHDPDLEAASAALVALAEYNIPVDIQELLVRGAPTMGVAPGAIAAACKAIIVSYTRTAALANRETSAPLPEPWRVELDEIIGHLGAAIMQSTDSDDRIIMDHVKAAHEIAKIVRRKA